MAFLGGGGEMGARMRALDWRATPLGDPALWPQSLKTVVRVMLDSRYAMWMAWGRELTFFCNDAYLPTVGIKRDWVLGSPSNEVWEEIWPDIGPRIERVLTTGTATWDEGLLLFLERSGAREETYHTFSYSPLRGDDNSVQGMLCVVTEETERVIGERRVKLLRDLAAEFASSKTREQVLAGLGRCLGDEARDLPFSVTYLLDERGEFALAASSNVPAGAWPRRPDAWPLQEVLAASTAREVGLASREVPQGPWAWPATRARLQPIAQQGRLEPAGVFIAGINPSRPLDAAYAGFLDLLVGQVSAALGAVQAYEAERRRAESLAELDRAKTAFFSNVSHEFRTPLTLMLGPVEELLTRHDVAPEVLEQVALVQRNALRLSKLVNSLLDFSRLEAGRLRAVMVPVDLCGLTVNLASMFRAAFDRAGIRFTVDCDDLGEPAAVDPEMWEKIVLNLLSNALKFTFEGEVALALRREGGQAVLRVRDTGTGIPPEHLPKLWERFHRVDGAPSRTQEGSGIGLALVQELVKLHDGDIAVRSEVGRGTEFIVHIPIGRPAAATEHAVPARSAVTNTGRAYVEEALRWLPDAAGPQARATKDSPAREPRVDEAGMGADITVLVADDNADMRDYLRQLLSPHYNVRTVANGAEALAAARADRPACIVTDVMMPVLDGFGLIRAVREDASLDGVPIIVLSARAGDEARAEGIERGADDYLVKPFHARELVSRVGAQVQRDRTVHVLQRLFEQAPGFAAVLTGPDHVFTMANAEYLRLVGDRRVLGLPMRVALPELVDQGYVAILDRVLATGEPFVGRGMPAAVREPGTGVDKTIYVDFVCQPFELRDGKPAGIFVQGHDVTHQYALVDELKEADRRKDDFLAVLAHELRNPLAPISNAVQLLKLPDAAAAHATAHGILDRQLAHITRLIDDLLDVSRITRGKLELRMETLVLADVLHDACDTSAPALAAKRQRLEIALPEQAVHVHGDRTRLAQVFANLLNNASKFSEEGSAIHVTAHVEDARLTVRVKDEGVGIPLDMLAAVFEPFAQAKNTGRMREGLGIGLTLARELLALQGGSIEAASSGPGTGSEFVVTLPVVAPQVVIRPTAPGAAAATARHRVRVLIADDNQDFAASLSQLLELEGHEAIRASDGVQAIEAADAFRPELLLLDIGMPRLDGIGAARALRDRDWAKSATFVALTGWGQVADRARTHEAGFDAHLVKPIAIERLKELIDRRFGAPVAAQGTPAD